jgi:hypothetical protein
MCQALPNVPSTTQCAKLQSQPASVVSKEAANKQTNQQTPKQGKTKNQKPKNEMK